MERGRGNEQGEQAEEEEGRWEEEEEIHLVMDKQAQRHPGFH